MSCRYDYLEFTDSNGNKKRFDQKVDTEKWPKVSDKIFSAVPFCLYQWRLFGLVCQIFKCPPFFAYLRLFSISQRFDCSNTVSSSANCFVCLFVQSYTFKAGNRLLFNFHSDGSNNEWGYKFTVIKMMSNFILFFPSHPLSP